MNKQFRRALVLTLLVALVTAVPALAGRPQSLHIEVADLIGDSGETFTASGSAVDDGLVCGTGVVTDNSVVPAGSVRGPYTILRVHKTFDCADDSGSFDIRMTVQLDNSSLETTARWRIAGGSGDYGGLRGQGSLVGTPIIPGTSILDVYDGWAH